MVFFEKIDDMFWQLAIFAKCSITDVWKGHKHIFETIVITGLIAFTADAETDTKMFWIYPRTINSTPFRVKATSAK